MPIIYDQDCQLSCKTIGELHVLLSLCGASSNFDQFEDAERLFQQLSPYLLEAHEQAIAHSPYLLDIDPSPWEALSHSLTTALLTIGIKHSSLSDQVNKLIFRYISKCSLGRATDHNNRIQQNGTASRVKHKKPLEVVVLSMSILGFMEATSQLVHSFNQADRLELVTQLHSVLSDDFMVATEGALSSLRNMDATSRAIKSQQQFVDKYSKSGRPLGAMLLQQAFMATLVSCGSLQIANSDILQASSVLDYLMVAPNPQLYSRSQDQGAMVEALSSIAADSIRVLDDGLDYLELSSAWQQHLALKTRALAFTTYLTCVLVDENVAEADVLTTWLDSAMSDSIQTTNPGLSSVVFKCLAILAKTSTAVAASLTRLLPRFVVQVGNNARSVDVAARCFAAILQVLSQDAAITSLYSLGNVLSVSSSEKSLTSNFYRSGALGAKGQSHFTQHSTASAISFDAHGDEEMSEVYANVIRAIVTIATICPDRNLLPLAQSMLLQKLQRLNPLVDSMIIIETASFGAVSEQSELRSLLKLYDRIGHDAVASKNEMMLDAVSIHSSVCARCLTVMCSSGKPMLGWHQLYLETRLPSKRTLYTS